MCVTGSDEDFKIQTGKPTNWKKFKACKRSRCFVQHEISRDPFAFLGLFKRHTPSIKPDHTDLLSNDTQGDKK